MRLSRSVRLAAAPIVLAGSGNRGPGLGAVCGGIADCCSSCVGLQLDVALASASAGNLPKLVVDGVVAKTITLESPRRTQPQAAPGTFDDYHCTLINPHITDELVHRREPVLPREQGDPSLDPLSRPPNLAAAAERCNKDGNGWSCFGEAPIPSTSTDQISNTPWLTAWGPGAPENVEPAGTGVPLPAGSLVIEQIHYNLLIGDKPVRAKLELQTVPETTPLKPSSSVCTPHLRTSPARPASTARSATAPRHSPTPPSNSGRARSPSSTFSSRCAGRNPVDPPAGDTTSCTWPVGQYRSTSSASRRTCTFSAYR